MCAYRKVRRVNSGQRRPVRAQSDSYYDESEYPEHHQHQRRPAHGRANARNYRMIKKKNNTVLIVSLICIACFILVISVYFLSDTKIYKEKDEVLYDTKSVLKSSDVVFNDEFYQSVVEIIENSDFKKKDILTRASILINLQIKLEDAYDRRVLKLDKEYNILSQEDKTSISKGLISSKKHFEELFNKKKTYENINEEQIINDLKEDINNVFSDIYRFKSNINLIENRCKELRITFQKGELIFLTDVRNLLSKIWSKWDDIRVELKK